MGIQRASNCKEHLAVGACQIGKGNSPGEEEGFGNPQASHRAPGHLSPSLASEAIKEQRLRVALAAFIWMMLTTEPTALLSLSIQLSYAPLLPSSSPGPFYPRTCQYMLTRLVS